jgi:hypothetical protein
VGVKQNKMDALLQQHAAELASKQKAHEHRVAELMRKSEEEAQSLQAQQALAAAAHQASILKSPVNSEFYTVTMLGH